MLGSSAEPLPDPQPPRQADDEARLLRGPDGVDPGWYRQTYPDVAPDEDPVDHYASHGWSAGRNPNAWFSTRWYLATYQDIAAVGMNPLLHFLQAGRTEGRLPNAEGPDGVDSRWYLARYPELGSGVDAVTHYAERGWREGKDPNPGFSTDWYLANYPDIAAVGMNPLQHYLQYGRAEGRTSKPALVDTVRAHDWWSAKIGPVYGVVYATALLLKVSILSLWPVLLLLTVALAPGAAYVALINDLTDRTEDKASGKPNGLIGKSSGKIALLLACCIVPGVVVAASWRHDPLLLGLYLGAWAIFSLYSVPPARLKGRGILGVLADASGAHLLPSLVAVVLVYRWKATVIAPVWFAAIAAWSLCYGLRGIIWHQLSDRGNDAKVGLGTFVQRHGPEAARRLCHFVVFPLECGGLAIMLWLLSSPAPVIFLLAYVIAEVWRSRVSGNSVLVYPREGVLRSGVYYPLALYPYYELLFPFAVLLSSSFHHPADVLIVAVHIMIFSLAALRREAKSLLATAAKAYFPPQPVFDRLAA